MPMLSSAEPCTWCAAEGETGSEECPGCTAAPEQESPCMKKIEGTEKKYLQNTELSYIM